MKRNLNVALKDLDGMELMEAGKPVTLKSIAVNALMAPHEDDRNLSGEDKVKRYKLATRIHGAADEMDLSSEEITQIKQLIGRGFVPLIVGQAFEILEE